MIGHNSGKFDADRTEGSKMIGHNSSDDRLKSFIERAERLQVDKDNIAADMRELFKEAKSTGYDPKIMRQLIKLRAMDESDRIEQEELLQVYAHSVGF